MNFILLGEIRMNKQQNNNDSEQLNIRLQKGPEFEEQNKKEEF